MAQAGMAAPIAAVPFGTVGSSTALPAEDLRSIRECEKIIKFQESVLSGNHPRIKLSSNIGNNIGGSSISEDITTINSQKMANSQAFQTNGREPAAGGTTSSGGQDSSKNLGSAKTEINPVLLEKSDDLIKAELHLQRQRLERSLREEIEQRRASLKASLSEQLPDFDLSDILAKALTLVQATSAPLPTAANTAADASSSSDSFDEATFYSSQHDTPEFASRGRSGSEEMQLEEDEEEDDEASPYVPPVDSQNILKASNAQLPHPPGLNTHISAAQPTQPISQPNPSYPPKPTGSTQYSPVNLQTPNRAGTSSGSRQSGDIPGAQPLSSLGIGIASRAEDLGNTDSERRTDQTRPRQQAQYMEDIQYHGQGSPVVRAHDLQPVAPQPAHVSPLATARQPPLAQQGAKLVQGAPAQVAALRQEPAVISSPESSPQGGRNGEKKKGKKKNKRKSEGKAAAAPISPYIKPEPRSPSPLTAPHARPLKRQRPGAGVRPQLGLTYDEPLAEEVRYTSYRPETHRREALPEVYERVGDPYARPAHHSAALSGQAYGRDMYDDGRISTAPIVRRVRSPSVYALPGEPRAARAVSHAVVDPTYREPPTYYREGRSSVRPVQDRARSRSPVVIERASTAMAPPRPAPTRIVVDQFGREYMEPHRPAVSRQSIAPPLRPGESDIIYERASTRAASRMPASDTFEQGGVIYRRASPAYAPRRVVTQPEYATADPYRSYRQRDYPVYGEEVVYRSAGDRGHVEPAPTEYITRTASVRPAEPIRYETVGGYGRTESIRPEVSAREYASVRPEASAYPTRSHLESRQDMGPPVTRAYSVMPAEQDIVRRDYGVRPAPQYYERSVQPGEEVAYMERPRGGHREIIYTDEGPRPVYQ